MSPRLLVTSAVLAALVLALPGPGAHADVRPHAGMLRHPDVSSSHIVFVYANDVWIVPRAGGVASPLVAPPGPEAYPRFSPDGKSVAFMGNYEGNTDIYSVAVDGGEPLRVTYHPATERLCGWTPDGDLLFFQNGLSGISRTSQLFTVPPTGGMPEKLPVPYGAWAAISGDGEWLAYTPHTRDHATWKRYRGGMATDVWLFNLKTKASRRITDWEGTDSQPMWNGAKLYFVSDAGPAHRLNVWVHDPADGSSRQVTRFDRFDVKWPSIGPGDAGQGEIVFQLGSELHLLDLATEEDRRVEVVVPGDRPRLRPRRVNASELVQGMDVSPTGKRAVVEARGDIWTVPVKDGPTRNLTRTSGAAERGPAWSPDGRWIAYFSDATGEYELYLVQSDGKGEARRLTDDGAQFRSRLAWSPDSKRLTFADNSGALFLHTLEGAKTKRIDTHPLGNPMRANWSHDSRWITYARPGDGPDAGRRDAVWLHDVEEGTSHQLTAGRFADSWPTFDRHGDYLYFASHRDFGTPSYGDVSTAFVYQGTDVLVVVPLRADQPSPFAPKSDEEPFKVDEVDDAAADEPKKDDAADENAPGDGEHGGGEDGDGKNGDDTDEEAKPGGDDAPKRPGARRRAKRAAAKGPGGKPRQHVRVDVEGFESRALRIPVARGAFSHLAVTHDKKLVYVRGVPRGATGSAAVAMVSVTDAKPTEKTVLAGVGSFDLSADGKQILARKGRSAAIVRAAPGQSMKRGLDFSGLQVVIEPRAEWAQIVRDAWRLERQFFYDPQLHGVDWDAMYERYAAMLPDCVTRGDVGHVIREMISELNVGHAYYGGGDVESAPSVSVGMLGVDFELHEGAYRIARLHRGADWDLDARSPLGQPAVDVGESDYILAVNGEPIDPTKAPWAAFQGLGDKVVTLTVSASPTLDDTARDVVVKTLKSEQGLRYRAWIESNRRYVEERTDGRVGYVYVPNTGVGGQNDLVRQFYGQNEKPALIVDERWNGGGQIPTRFIEILDRPLTNYWARRHGKDWAWPPDSHQGPKCMLINGLAGSGGDAFPAYFRQAGLGKLIGTRTWGGLVGIQGAPRLVDGARVTIPSFAYYDRDGTWGIEGHGVDPDIEVIDDPALMTDGGDPQLDAAIDQMLRELETAPPTHPDRPGYPDRSGMGIRDEDK